MKTRSLLSLLYASIFGILFILALVAGYTLGADDSSPVVTEAGETTAVTSAPVDPAVKLGRAVWNTNACGACHAANMKDNMTGPALSGVAARWAAHPREDLYAWIRNSQALVAAGHPRAVKVWTENKKNVMTNYPDLTDEEIAGLLAYIDHGH